MNFIKKLLNFDDFITPTIIKILYYIFAILIIIYGLYQMFTSINYFGWGGGWVFFTGLLTVILGPILIRVYFEILIILFKIYDKLSTITKQLENKNEMEDDTTL